MILETVLDAPDRNDYVQVARDAAASQAQSFPQMLKEMAAEKKVNISSNQRKSMLANTTTRLALTT